jgi:ferredoxin
MLLVENQFAREQVQVIGVVCPGVMEKSRQRPVGLERSVPATGDHRLATSRLQPRCQTCTQRTPYIYDWLVGDLRLIPRSAESPPQGYPREGIAWLKQASPEERREFWLSQFDRCLRCYACRQACPMCNCPTCLYERDDSLWAGMGIEINEKRAFHLGRAYHLAGRCIGCDECERVCPVGIPISLLNRMLADEMAASFDYHAGYAAVPSPFVTILGGKEG